MTIQNEVIKQISEYCNWVPPTINVKDELWNDLGLDDLDFVLLAQHIEQAFNVEISDEDINGWHTVACIIKSVKNFKNRA